MHHETAGGIEFRPDGCFEKIECNQMPEPGIFIPCGVSSDVVYHACLPVLMRLREPTPYYNTGDYLSTMGPGKVIRQGV